MRASHVLAQLGPLLELEAALAAADGARRLLLAWRRGDGDGAARGWRATYVLAEVGGVLAVGGEDVAADDAGEAVGLGLLRLVGLTDVVVALEVLLELGVILDGLLAKCALARGGRRRRCGPRAVGGWRLGRTVERLVALE